MKAKVTLKEIVAERMVYALLLVHYYWMWARRDWHDYYMTIQNTINIFAIVFFRLAGQAHPEVQQRRKG